MNFTINNKIHTFNYEEVTLKNNTINYFINIINKINI